MNLAQVYWNQIQLNRIGGKKMQEQNSNVEDWREEVSDSSKATLKIADGESVVVTFLSEGKKRSHQDFGESVVFEVKKGEEEFTWYVNANNFSLLKQIKELGVLLNSKAKISRTGSKKSDTRYTIVSE